MKKYSKSMNFSKKYEKYEYWKAWAILSGKQAATKTKLTLRQSRNRTLTLSQTVSLNAEPAALTAPAVGTLYFRLWLRVSAAITALP